MNAPQGKVNTITRLSGSPWAHYHVQEHSLNTEIKQKSYSHQTQNYRKRLFYSHCATLLASNPSDVSQPRTTPSFQSRNDKDSRLEYAAHSPKQAADPSVIRKSETRRTHICRRGRGNADLKRTVPIFGEPEIPNPKGCEGRNAAFEFSWPCRCWSRCRLRGTRLMAVSYKTSYQRQGTYGTEASKRFSIACNTS